MARRSRDYYELLGVPPDASREEIHSAYRRLARRYHPDVNAGGDGRVRFHELSDAYEVLHDPAQRARYDRSMAVDPPSHATQVPFFSARRPGRDVPRFLDFEPRGLGVRLVRSVVAAWARSVDVPAEVDLGARDLAAREREDLRIATPCAVGPRHLVGDNHLVA